MYRTVHSNGASLVVRGLPEPVTADDLKEAYGGFGEVVCAEVKHVGEGKYSRNTGYVTFALDSAAANAQSATDGRTIDCKHCTVLLDVAFGQATERPIDNPQPDTWGRDRYPTRNAKPDHDRKVFVRNFPGGFSVPQLTDLFKACGPIEYTEIRRSFVYGSSNLRPYAFVCFERVESAGEAVQTMNGFIPPSSNSQIMVDFARPPHRATHGKRGMGRGGPGGHRGRDNTHRGGWLSGSRNGRMYGRKSSFYACNGGDRLETASAAVPPYHETHGGSATNENGNHHQHPGAGYGGSPGEKMLKKNEWKVMEQKKKNGGRHKN